jgi:Fe-S cluster assembly protein SufD
MNLAFHRQGAFFYLPPQLKATTPMQALHITTGQEPLIAPSRLFLIVGAQSQIHWITTALNKQSGIPHFIVPATEISLEDGASLDLLNLVEVDFASWYTESTRVTLKKDARLNALSFTLGAKTVRQSYRIYLKGENSEAALKGLWMLSKNRTAHTHAIVEHAAPRTRSMQLFKGILCEASQSSFEGKIFVRPEAQKTEAYQLNHNLILSQGAVANSKPNLEIFADDVKASHGATVSQPDPDQLFYLSTRGIDSCQAKRLLINGFCREMLEGIPYDFLLQKIMRQISTFLLE